MRFILSLSLILSLAFSVSAQDQTSNTWKTLAKITYKKQYDELMGFKIDISCF